MQSGPEPINAHITDQYIRFCDKYLYNPYPATSWRLCQYAIYLAREEKVPETIQNYVSTIRMLHQVNNLHIDDTHHIHLTKINEALKKDCKKPVRQASPMTHEILRQLFPDVNFACELEAVAWVSLLVGFSLVLRVSNLGPPSHNKFNRDMNLVRHDLQSYQERLTLNIRWAKNIQHRNRHMVCPLIPAKDPRICPECWVCRMIKLIPAHQDELFFLVRDKGTRLALSSPQISRLLKKWCKAAGLDATKYMPNCLRRGGLTWAHQANLSGETLQILGGWVSHAYKRYIEHDFDSRIESGKRMAQVEV